jgi:hypothetical protein
MEQIDKSGAWVYFDGASEGDPLIFAKVVFHISLNGMWSYSKLFWVGEVVIFLNFWY